MIPGVKLTKNNQIHRVNALVPFIFLINHMTAGLAVGCVIIVIAQSTMGADDVPFAVKADPLFDDAADLPGDQNDPRQNHQEGHPFSAFGKGGDVAETNRGQGHHGEIESIGEGGDAGIDGMLDPIKKDR